MTDHVDPRREGSRDGRDDVLTMTGSRAQRIKESTLQRSSNPMPLTGGTPRPSFKCRGGSGFKAAASLKEGRGGGL